jgi:hypothetical protein
MNDFYRLLAGVVCILFGMLPDLLCASTLHFPYKGFSLQDVVSIADSGDTIIVAPGTYRFFFENLVIINELLRLKSAAGPEKTILLGTGRGPVVSFSAGSKAILEGFTIRSMSSPRKKDLKGGGIYCAPESAPVIKNNVITSNEAVYGGGIYCDILSTPRIDGNIITGNKATVTGGGLFSYHSSALITNNRFIANEAQNSGGAIAGYRDSVRVRNNVMWKNKAAYGGGLSFDRAAPDVSNNTIAENMADFGGGIVVDKGSVRLTNIILWHNTGGDLFLKQVGPSARPINSVIGDGTFRGMNGNIVADPLFVDVEAGDFRLLPGSPAIDAGSIDPFYEDVDGSVNDIGAYGGPGVVVTK